LSHVDHALQVEVGGGGCGRHPVLARPGLGDHPPLAHPPGQQRLPEHVADLVRAGVVEVLPLEQHRRTDPLGQRGGLVQPRRAAGVLAQHPVARGPEPVVCHRLPVRGGQLVRRGDQRLGHEPSAKASPVPALVGPCRRAHLTSAHITGRGVAGWLPAVTSSATASRGPFLVTRASPTRHPAAPADAYRIRSCGPRTPDSATLTTWLGRPGATRSNTARSTCMVRRSRALTPITRAPASSARSASRSSCTSTSAVMPSDSIRSRRPTRTCCSRAATTSRTRSAPYARASCTWWLETMTPLRSTGP